MNSDSNSLFSFNPVDYIDLDTALAEEELCSVTHSPTRDHNYCDKSYRISFKSIDDGELDNFRRSLVTPMSLNAKSQDPMYANVPFSRPNNTTTNNSMYTSWKRQSPISPPHATPKDLKRQNTTSPTNSYTESVTESVALFNNILNDETSVDLVASDLKDFMGSYNMDDLISRPGSRLPTTPSPQNIGRHNRDALVTRHYNHSPQVINNTNRYSLPLLPSKEAKQDININDNLISSSNFPTNMDNINKVTPPTTSSGVSKPKIIDDIISPRKQSFDASVQTPLSFTATRRLSSPALQLDTNNHHAEEEPVPIRTSSKERVEKRLSLMKLKQPQQQPAIKQPTPIRRINNRLQSASDDKRRWSSYIPGHSDNMEFQKEESKLCQLRNSSRLPAKEELVINNRENNGIVRPKPVPADNRNSLVSSSRYVEKRASNRGSLLLDQPSEANNGELKPVKATEKNTRNVITSSRYVERRASNRGSLLTNQRNSNKIDSNSKPTPVMEQSHRYVTTSSRYMERRASNRDSLLIDQNSNIDLKPTPGTSSSRYVERRASYREPNLTSRRASNSNHNTESNIAAPAQRNRDISSSSRYIERHASNSQLNMELKSLAPSQRREISSSNRRASNSHLNTETNSSATSQRRDISSSSRYVEKRASNSNINTETNSSAPVQRSRDVTSSSRYVERRASYREPITGYQPSAQNKRASYHGGYGNLPPIVPTVTATYDDDFKQQPSVSTQRRARALSVPSSNQYSRNNIEYSTAAEQPLKPSLMPMPVSRYRKHSNNSLSKYASVPENEVAPHQPIAKEVRFSLNNNRRNSNDVNDGGNYQEKVQLVASRSTGGYSNSTTSSSHSGDLEYDPPTPPSSYIDHSITSRHDKRRSVPVFTNKDVPPQVPRLNRYSSYLARLKDTYEVPLEEDDIPVTTQIPRRQRVVSEDNEYYKGQQRRQQQNSVTESAKQVLAQVQQRRAKTAAILGSSSYK